MKLISHELMFIDKIKYSIDMIYISAVFKRYSDNDKKKNTSPFHVMSGIFKDIVTMIKKRHTSVSCQCGLKKVTMIQKKKDTSPFHAMSGIF